MYRSSRLCSTVNTNVITGWDMFQVCTEAVDCVALWTRTSSQVCTCFKYDPKIRKNEALLSQVWTCVTSLTKTKTLLPVGRIWVLGRACCRNHMKRCLICTKTSVYYGEYMIKNARDQWPGRNHQGPPFFIAHLSSCFLCFSLNGFSAQKTNTWFALAVETNFHDFILLGL